MTVLRRALDKNGFGSFEYGMLLISVFLGVDGPIHLDDRWFLDVATFSIHFHGDALRLDSMPIEHRERVGTE